MPQFDLGGAPIAFLFFGATLVVAFLSIDEPAMRMWIHPGPLFFTALGPIHWLGRSLMSAPNDTDRGNGFAAVGDFLTEKGKRNLRLVVWISQVILMTAGVAAFSLAALLSISE